MASPRCHLITQQVNILHTLLLMRRHRHGTLLLMRRHCHGNGLSQCMQIKCTFTEITMATQHSSSQTVYVIFLH